MATYNNFSISKKKGKFYLKEKQPTEGYVEVVYGVNNDKKTYHRYFDKVEGTIDKLETKEVEYDGRKLHFLELTLNNGDEINKISTSLKNKGGYTDEVKAILSAMNGYKVGEPVSVTARTSESTGKNGKVYENFNVYVNYNNIKNDDGKSASTGYISYEEIPGPIKTDDGMGGVTWDWTPSNKFYYSKLQEIEARLSGAPEKKEEVKKEPAEQKTKKEPVTDDNLPF